jgi:predicted Zn-dependent protease
MIHHPVTGVGPEGYRIVFGRFVDAGYQRTYGRDPLPDRAHSSLLDVGVTTGVPGLVGFVVLLGLAGLVVRRAMRQGPPWLAGVAAGLAAYTFAELALFPVAEIEPGAWLLMGVLSSQVLAEAEMVVLRIPRLTRLAIAAVCSLAVVAGVRATAADRATRAALAASTRGAQGIAADKAAHAVAWDPGDIVVRLAAAQVDAAGGTLPDLDRALTQIRAALAISPGDPVLGDEQAQLLLHRAQLSGAPGDWRMALHQLSARAHADPRNPAVLVPLGVAEAATGRDRGAVRDWEAAVALDPRGAAAQTDLAVFYANRRSPGPARAAALAALRRDPADAVAAAVLAQIGEQRGT